MHSFVDNDKELTIQLPGKPFCFVQNSQLHFSNQMHNLFPNVWSRASICQLQSFLKNIEAIQGFKSLLFILNTISDL